MRSRRSRVERHASGEPAALSGVMVEPKEADMTKAMMLTAFMIGLALAYKVSTARRQVAAR